VSGALLKKALKQGGKDGGAQVVEAECIRRHAYLGLYLGDHGFDGFHG
jgi:hypothetical protein